jgi:hypothetical protein
MSATPVLFWRAASVLTGAGPELHPQAENKNKAPIQRVAVKTRDFRNLLRDWNCGRGVAETSHIRSRRKAFSGGSKIFTIV